MKIGIIQTRGLGDIVIATPIAMYYIERGCDVYWPIDSEFIPSFKEAFPKINFLAIEKSATGIETAEYFYHSPLDELNKIGCKSVICLYSHLTGFDLGNTRIRESITFDAYKYAVANVPFTEKWNFSPKRNVVREGKLFELLKLNPTDSYNVIQNQGSNFTADIESHIANKELRTINISPLTNNIFDWIGVLECADHVYLVDSVYSNIVEQLDICKKKSLFLRSQFPMTPVLKNGWLFI
jgi:hypothetical protein